MNMHRLSSPINAFLQRSSNTKAVKPLLIGEDPMDMHKEAGECFLLTDSMMADAQQAATRDISVELSCNEQVRGENVMRSPLSLDALLSMLALGSSGRTSEQPLHCLGCDNLINVRFKVSKLMNVASTT
ncbi:hypothetical protein K2173_007495 [Erythroxylum novogranatense]|uniref:Serpin domain-containing protein n=1 Tax=Erythroxylum novogranatense TaxID=1862640 RepID=A0AAV8T6C9_9ROSI|nr:hypothetical protein K2173_007495 [Erythroxylum novogranatense]